MYGPVFTITTWCQIGASSLLLRLVKQWTFSVKILLHTGLMSIRVRYLIYYYERIMKFIKFFPHFIRDNL